MNEQVASEAAGTSGAGSYSNSLQQTSSSTQLELLLVRYNWKELVVGMTTVKKARNE